MFSFCYQESIGESWAIEISLSKLKSSNKLEPCNCLIWNCFQCKYFKIHVGTVVIYTYLIRQIQIIIYTTNIFFSNFDQSCVWRRLVYPLQYFVLNLNRNFANLVPTLIDLNFFLLNEPPPFPHPQRFLAELKKGWFCFTFGMGHSNYFSIKHTVLSSMFCPIKNKRNHDNQEAKKNQVESASWQRLLKTDQDEIMERQENNFRDWNKTFSAGWLDKQ